MDAPAPSQSMYTSGTLYPLGQHLYLLTGLWLWHLLEHPGPVKQKYLLFDWISLSLSDLPPAWLNVWALLALVRPDWKVVASVAWGPDTNWALDIQQ